MLRPSCIVQLETILVPKWVSPFCLLPIFVEPIQGTPPLPGRDSSSELFSLVDIFGFNFSLKKKKWNAGPVLTRGQVLQTWTRGTSKCVVAQSCPTLCDPWTVACQAPLSMEFSRQEDEWVAMPFCRGFSWPRDQTWVFCIAERFFTVTTEATPGWTRDVTSRHSEFKWHPDPSSRTPAPAEGALPGSLFSWPPRKSQTVLKILTEC